MGCSAGVSQSASKPESLYDCLGSRENLKRFIPFFKKHAASLKVELQDSTAASTLLQSASSSDDPDDDGEECVKVLKFLREQGLDLDAADEDGNTAIVAAAKCLNMPCIQFLADAGVNLDVIARDGEKEATLLMFVAQSWGAEKVLKALQYLHQKGANLEAKTDVGESVVFAAAEWCNVGVFRYLWETGVDLHAFTNEGESAVIRAASKARLEITHADGEALPNPEHVMDPLLVVRFLHDKGADLDAQTSAGENAVMKAASCGNMEVLQYLGTSGANLHAVDRSGKNALVHAVLRCQDIKAWEESDSDSSGSRPRRGKKHQWRQDLQGWREKFVMYLLKEGVDCTHALNSNEVHAEAKAFLRAQAKETATNDKNNNITGQA